MSRKLFLITLLFLLVVGVSFYLGDKIGLADFFQLERESFQGKLEDLNLNYEPKDILTALENTSNHSLREDIVENLVRSGPLIGRGGSGEYVLTEEGIVFWTNSHRRDEGMSTLSKNHSLNQVAYDRARDMFLNQYFDHVSPDEVEASSVARDRGYQYIAIGENIALGNFPDSASLVEAWMDSPGHRENILSDNFTEIGVAALRDIFEGQEVWISVQIFGRPLSDCPQPDESLNLTIKENKEVIEGLEKEIESLSFEIENAEPGSPERSEIIDRHNELIKEINPLILETKDTIEVFNAQVFEFNLCLGL